jgi:hypothetical protein
MSELSVGQLRGLTVNSNIVTVPSGHTLYAPGHVIQVGYGESTNTTTVSTTSFVQIGGSALSATITPKFTNSKILVTLNVGYYSSSSVTGYLSIFRNNTTNIATSGYYAYQAGEFNYGTMQFLDSPNTTSPVTYSAYMRNHVSGQAFTVNYNDGGGQVRSSITVMEIAQ